TPLCLDTGHLAIGGTDPGELISQTADRIAHVHLKDVDLRVAGEVRAGRIGYAAAVKAGLYRPLGDGNLDMAGLVRKLGDGGYRGWYVLEQDVALESRPKPGSGPKLDVARSLRFIESQRDAVGP
ncbi:MAG TPA: TIM barrel protein, partial [Candidatus Dormibacteraeota bacterium]|nr:TIM barrel protein [Candidatus Dormibacteraeota bacterium]